MARVSSLARHDLAWLAPDAAAAARLAGTACICAARASALLDDWIRRGHPLIVTRQDPAAADDVLLGLALPPAQGRMRLAFRVPRHGLRETRRPPTLLEASPRLPAHWQEKAAALISAAEVAAACPRLYGSAAIEIVTGEPCIAPASDLDLLLAPSTWARAGSVAAALTALDACAGPRLDGEIVTPAGAAVAWRELAMRPRQILVKGQGHVGLMGTAAFARGFAALAKAA
ncbi:MAG: malonate decarboxylase holo-[acyl-carrier-protein] synthase [Burkholderiales bacterium]